MVLSNYHETNNLEAERRMKKAQIEKLEFEDEKEYEDFRQKNPRFTENFFMPQSIYDYNQFLLS